jgi:NAD(P)-dependent dehydrogenase (short-subunit alcohol dehydrogenase family)
MDGKVVLITGASSGIGEALAREVARRGAIPVLAVRRIDRIETIARPIREAGGRAVAEACDAGGTRMWDDPPPGAARSSGV